jgi:hypothetical protein
MRHLEEANPPAGSKRPAAPSVRGASKQPKTEIVPVQLPPCELCGNFGHTGNNFKVCPLALGREPLTALLATAEQHLLKGQKGKARLPRNLVDIIPIRPDGNCMFAALSVSFLCFTRRQNNKLPVPEKFSEWGNRLRSEYLGFIALKLAEDWSFPGDDMPPLALLLESSTGMPSAKYLEVMQTWGESKDECGGTLKFFF